ncbi:hypothetical protein COU79_04790 [Candidatus Peregrinibacteria bacterium CG10_big_fil_rev_8_21_14_0_10_54_7]|nr:MAG: hypothetical protein COU79_04790 [Candidatus Peregrinibacteria bacterium CG10_big_fil_rev_8_21_14_0_10_54_7]
MTRKRKRSILLSTGFLCVMVVVAGILRYVWIFPIHPWETLQQYLDSYVYSDMLAHWVTAQKYWAPGAQWGYADLMYPPGTGAFLALVFGPHMDRLGLFLFVQWLQTMWIFLGAGYLAFLLYGRRVGMIALFIAALSFPLFDYGVYVLSETPFTSLLLAGAVFMVLAVRRKRYQYFLLAGIFFGLSATMKSIGLVVGVLLLPVFFLPHCWREKRRVRMAFASLLCAGLLLVVVPVSMLMTVRNHGEFMLFAHDVNRMALVNHGNLRDVYLALPEGGYYMNGAPTSYQKGFFERRDIDLQKDNIIAQNIRWVLDHPFHAFTSYLERTADYVYGTLPFPTCCNGFRPLSYFSGLMLLLFIFVPAAAWAMRARERFSRKECLLSLIILLPLASLPLVAIVSVTEPRYLHPFVPFLIVFASAWYEKKLTKSK